MRIKPGPSKLLEKVSEFSAAMQVFEFPCGHTGKVLDDFESKTFEHPCINCPDIDMCVDYYLAYCGTDKKIISFAHYKRSRNAWQAY